MFAGADKFILLVSKPSRLALTKLICHHARTVGTWSPALFFSSSKINKLGVKAGEDFLRSKVRALFGLR